jgi:hypothetical protein
LRAVAAQASDQVFDGLAVRLGLRLIEDVADALLVLLGVGEICPMREARDGRNREEISFDHRLKPLNSGKSVGSLAVAACARKKRCSERVSSMIWIQGLEVIGHQPPGGHQPASARET